MPEDKQVHVTLVEEDQQERTVDARALRIISDLSEKGIRHTSQANWWVMSVTYSETS